MKLNHIRVQNLLGARAVDIPITTHVALIAGRNYAGKSSVQEAVRMALAAETVRVDLKKDYGLLVSEGADHGLAEVGIADGPVAWFSVPDGKHTPLTEYVPPPALPYVLDAQRFSRLDENARRSFLFGLLGVKTDGPAVRERLVKWGCDTAKIEATMPLLRAGFAAASEEAKNKARDAKAAWRTVTGETYGEKKAVGWRAQKPEFNEADLTRADEKIKAAEAEIATANQRLGELQGRQRHAKELSEQLAGLREKAGRLDRIQEKLTLDTEDRDDWRRKVEETRAIVGAVPAEHPLTCPHCAGLVLHRPNVIGGELQPYQPAPRVADPDAVAKLPEYEQALALLERSVANDKRDLAEAEAAANALKMHEGSGVQAPPDEAEVGAAQNYLADQRTELATSKAEHATLSEAKRKADQADEKTKSATQHHADVEAWSKIADALAPDGIPGELLSEALGPINARLEQSASDTGWRWIRINSAMEVLAAHDRDGGHPDRSYALLSESEKWRADAMIAEAIAHLSGLKLLVLDRFDVLDLQGRAELITWLDILASNGELDTALIFGTLKALPGQLPVTVDAHWIEAGVAGQIKQAA